MKYNKVNEIANKRSMLEASALVLTISKGTLHMATSDYTSKDIIRFWSKVKVTTLDGCWEWQASRTPLGYGQFGLKSKLKISSRVAWELTYGDIPEGLHVCHRCDNPPCCNPEHLFLGTNHENVRDSLNKGRRSPRKGENNGQHKLTAAQSQEIRQKYVQGEIRYADLANEYGVSAVQIGHIVTGKAWV